MSDAEVVVRLSQAEPARLAAAIESAIAGELQARLRAGAEESVRAEPADVAAARRFQTLLELGYLVASADGFADEESNSLASLLERVTSSAIDRAALTLHFFDLEDATQALGRRERLARVAAELEGAGEAEEAIGLVVTIAMADGQLSSLEYAVLNELAEHLKLSPGRLRELVDAAAARIEGGLA